jgi:hypothetical protein
LETQEHAVLKDAELLPLVLAARRGCAATATANPRRDRCGVALGCRRWSQPSASSAVATMLPHPTTTPAQPQPIIRIIGHELTRFQPLSSRNRRLWHS